MAKKIWISVGLAVVVLWVIGVLIWLANQPPVLGRSEEKDPLSGRPKQVTLNPIRDRAPERSAEKVLTAMRDGHCEEELTKWEKDYRKKYAKFICDSEGQHPPDGALLLANVEAIRDLLTDVLPAGLLKAIAEEQAAYDEDEARYEPTGY